MTLDLDNLRKLEAAATPGPWEAIRMDDGVTWIQSMGGHGVSVVAEHIGSEWNDPPFIAAARNALPALLADHARLEADLRRLTVANEIMAERITDDVAEEWRLISELAAERDAHHATCDALARERAEVANLRGSVESYMAMLDDANVDRSAALVRAERIEAESEAEVERLEQELVEAQSRESTAQEIHNESAAQWHAEVARLTAFIENDVTRRRTVIEAVASMPAVDAELDAARAEVARLRGLALRVGKWIRACIDTDHHTDQACAECVPGGPIVIPGFACVVHFIRKEAAGE